MISISQIYFNEETKADLDPAFYPYYNQSKDEYFENKVIREIYQMNLSLKKGMDYIGVTSWKQHEKTHLTGAEIISRINNDILKERQKDVYLYFPPQEPLEIKNEGEIIIHANIKEPDGWHFSRQRSEQLFSDYKRLNDSGVLPFDILDGAWQYNYSNYWIATQKVFDEYCRTCLVPAMNFFKSIEHKMPRHEAQTSGNRKITSISFALERLFGSFLAHSNYSFEYLCKKRLPGRYVRSRWIKIDEYINTQLQEI